MLAGEERNVGGHLQDIKSFRSFQLVPCTDKTFFQLPRKQDQRERRGKSIVKNSFLTSNHCLVTEKGMEKSLSIGPEKTLGFNRIL